MIYAECDQTKRFTSSSNCSPKPPNQLTKPNSNNHQQHSIKPNRNNNTSLNSLSSSSSSSCDYMAATGLSPKYSSTTASFSVNCLLNPTAAAVSTAAAFGSMLEESYRKQQQQPQFSPYQVNKTNPSHLINP